MANYLITGTSRGLGLAFVERLCASPPAKIGTIFATARTFSPALETIIAGSEGRVLFLTLDCTDKKSIDGAVEAVAHKLNGKGIDVLINNAGVQGTPASTEAMDNLITHFNINVLGVHMVTSAFLPLLRKGNEKKIVTISSTLGSLGLSSAFRIASVPAYKISKAAVNMLTVQYSLDLEKEGFVVFSISPGWLKTDLGGSYADLSVEEGAKATLEKIENAGPAQNGQFLNILVKGWENTGTMNQYDGLNPPW